MWLYHWVVVRRLRLWEWRLCARWAATTTKFRCIAVSPDRNIRLLFVKAEAKEPLR